MPRTNRLAIVALVSGLCGAVLFAVGFAIAAFVQIRRRGEKGRLFAAGGLTASAVWIVAVAVVVGWPADDEEPGPKSAYGQPRASTLKPGTCFIGFEEQGAGLFMRPDPCTGAHEGEIVAQVPLRDGPFPGDAAVQAEAEKTCQDRTRFLEKTGRESDFRLYIDRPGEQVWERGNRSVTCILRFVGSGWLTEPLKALLTGPRAYVDLTAGDCIREWEESGYEADVVPCTEKHQAQVFAVFELDGDEFPSEKEMTDRAAEGCAARAPRNWISRPPKNVLPNYLRPDKVMWDQGQREVMCLIETTKGPLKRSLLPK